MNKWTHMGRLWLWCSGHFINMSGNFTPAVFQAPTVVALLSRFSAHSSVPGAWHGTWLCAHSLLSLALPASWFLAATALPGGGDGVGLRWLPAQNSSGKGRCRGAVAVTSGFWLSQRWGLSAGGMSARCSSVSLDTLHVFAGHSLPWWGPRPWIALWSGRSGWRWGSVFIIRYQKDSQEMVNSVWPLCSFVQGLQVMNGEQVQPSHVSDAALTCRTCTSARCYGSYLWSSRWALRCVW